MADDQKKFEQAMKNLPATARTRGPSKDTKVADTVSKVARGLARPYVETGNLVARGVKKALPHVKRAMKSRGLSESLGKKLTR